MGSLSFFCRFGACRGCAAILRSLAALLLVGSLLSRELSGQSLSPPAQTVLWTMTKSTDGSSPNGPLVQAADGFFYGTNREGGPGNQGTIFRMSAQGGDFIVLRALGSNDGTGPSALTLGTDGRLYGSAISGGFRGNGTLFSLKRDGTDFLVLVTFNIATDGGRPTPLCEGSGGRFYGATATGGRNNFGTIFSVRKDGTDLIVLRHLALEDGGGCEAALVQGDDGRLYGAGTYGGTSSRGTVFALNPDGTGFTVLRNLTAAEGSGVRRRLSFAGGRLYGVADMAVFRLNVDGTEFTTLKSFGTDNSGYSPSASLISGPNGLLYGVTVGGGVNFYGTLFRIRSSDGSFAVVANLGSQTRWHRETLVLGADQKLYGVSRESSTSADGAIFSYAPTPQFTSPALASGTVGQFLLYPLAASGIVSGYSATGLPAGLAIDPSDGAISGTPKEAGTFSATVGATNDAGPGTAKLTFTIAKGLAAVTLSNLAQAYDGKAKPVTIVTSPAGLSTTTTYNGSATVPSDPGLYEVKTTIADANYTGSTTSNLTINFAAPTISATSGPEVVLSGASAALTVTAGGSPPFTYRWQRQEAGGAAFADLADGAVFSGTASATLTVLAPTLTMNGDQFRCVVTNAQGSATGTALRLSVLPGSRLRNISIRANVAASQPIVVGFVTNAGARRVLIRAIGPGLAPFVGGSAGLAGDPSLALLDAAGATAAANDNWAGAPGLASAFAAAGAFSLPAASLDAALLSDVSGAYTAQMKTTATGLGLVEVYDTSSDSARRMLNFSTLYRVGTGADALVAGFVIAGTGTKTLLVRGVGPALRAFGITDALTDAKLELFDSAGVSIVGNDDWAPALVSTFAEAGAFALPAASKDSAFVVTVGPGLYSVQLSIGNGPAGQGLIEVYELQR